MSQVQSQLEVLKKVQEVDRELYLCKGSLGEIPIEIQRYSDKLEIEKRQLLELEKTLKALQLKQKEKELELGQKEANVKKLDGQLSQVKTNKEYSALQQEIASLKADNSLLEEEIIKVLDEVEAAQEEVRKERERLKEKEKEFASAEAELKANEKNLQSNLDELKKKRQEILTQVDPETRQQYDAIVEKKQGIALARVSGDICGACQIKIRPQTLNEILSGTMLVSCENCSRFLYLEE